MLPLVGISAARRNDVAVVDEGVGDLDRLVEQPAGIVAQVEDIALQIRLPGRRRGNDRRPCAPRRTPPG